MDRAELDELWSETLRSEQLSRVPFDRIAAGLVNLYVSDRFFRHHIENRLRQISEKTGKGFEKDQLDLAMARSVVADEVGFESWDQLTSAVEEPAEHRRPILFQYAIAAMERGDFSALESMVGGPKQFDAQMIEWYENGYFDDEAETLAEIFSAACMLGYPRTADYLLDKGVDPYAGIRTGLSGFHYAASSGRLEVVKLLISRKVPMEVRNMYGGTVLEQALWSAVNEHTNDHAAIIEALIDAGAEIEDGSLEWWNAQDVPSSETKGRVADVLQAADKG